MSYVHEEPLTETNYPPFAEIKNTFGFIPNFFRAQSMRTDLIESELSLTDTILVKDGALTRQQKEYIFLVCSARNLSTYCVTAHCEIVRILGIAGPEPEQIALDHTATDLPIVDKALLNFALKLNNHSLKVNQEDIDTLRTYGFDDQQILEAVMCVGLAKFGNCVGFAAALELMETGIAGLLVGVGPGAACTSREVLGIGVPQVTATMDCAAARDAFHTRTGRYVPIITDGGMRTGGDVCKAFASGADAVMIGSPFAQAAEAPGRGHHWGMATPHAGLPRGTRIKVGVGGSLEQILFGPTSLTNGTQNLVGALRTCMGVVGAATLHDMHQAEMVIAPAIKTEGKSWQLAGA